jgi:hypothetical protein
MPFLAAISAGFTTSRVVLPGDGGGGGGGGGGGSFTWGGDRGLVAGGTSTGQNVIQYFDITTTGNAQDFGDLNFTPTRVAGLSNGTRAVFGGGFNGFTTYYNTMDYIIVATTGDAEDFGNLSQARSSLAGASDATTGIFAGGALQGTSFELDTIDSFTIATTGDATDFGNLTQGRSLIAGWNNSTRAVFAGGDPAGATQSNVMDYITIASAGDATDFGDMTDSWNRAGGSGDATYALFAGGRRAGSVNANGWTENIDYVTVATTGNATDFGDLTTFKDNVAGNSNGTRATFSGGSTNDGSNVSLNNIDYVTVATPGNATDFGDLLAVNESAAATSGNPSGSGAGASALKFYGDRGFKMGRASSPQTSGTYIGYWDMTSLGNSAAFGDLHKTMFEGSAVSDESNYVYSFQSSNFPDNREISYFVSTTLGNGSDYGDMVIESVRGGAVSNSTKGVIANGYKTQSGNTVVDSIEKIALNGTGANAADFGDMSVGRQGPAAFGNGIRGIFAGGYDGLTTGASSVYSDVLDYITIATDGNATDFGDAVSVKYRAGGAASGDRGIYAGGYQNIPQGTYSITNEIDYVSIPTTGNAQDFGDLLAANQSLGACANSTRVVFVGGFLSAAPTNVMQYVTIDTTGNAQDFGDLESAEYEQYCASAAPS